MEGGEKSWQLAHFAPDETPRSLQLYGTDPVVVGEAVRRLVDDDHVDHVDLNFGCPAPKVTRHGGGAAVPARPRLFGAVVQAAVQAAGAVPVTVKMRIGLDDERVTFVDAGRLAADAGAAAVALHARTAEQRYSGRARWSAIAELVEALRAPPCWATATSGPRRTPSPWWNARAAPAWSSGGPASGGPGSSDNSPTRSPGSPCGPSRRWARCAVIAREHARLLAENIDEDRGVRMMRKHLAWYLTGFPVGPAARKRLTAVVDAGRARRRPGRPRPHPEDHPGRRPSAPGHAGRAPSGGRPATAGSTPRPPRPPMPSPTQPSAAADRVARSG